MQRLLSPLDLKTNPHFTVDDTERSLRNEGGGSFKSGTQLMVSLMDKNIPWQVRVDVITGIPRRYCGLVVARLQTTAVQRVTRFFGVPVHIKVRFTLYCSLLGLQ